MPCTLNSPRILIEIGMKPNVALLLLVMLLLTCCLSTMHMVKPRVKCRKEYAFLPYVFRLIH